MNKLIYFIATTVNEKTLPSSESLKHIQQYTLETANNTTFEFWWDGFNILIAVIALVFSVFTFWSQNKTSSNTQKLSQHAQRNLLLDLVRHLYRNLVITYTVKTKLENIQYKGYPSEEHLIKLKVPMENIHLEAFYGNDRMYEVMHNLYLNLRNYNEEIDVACTHFKDANLSEEVKKRDLDTLLFKPSYLTERILMTMYELWNTKHISEDFNQEGYRERIIELLKDSDTVQAAKAKILEAQHGNSNASNDKDNSADNNFVPYTNEKSSYAQILFRNYEWTNFVDAFNQDVYAERGKNSQGGDKVYIISK
ncbi:MAG: hypothetical protein E7096_02750 [Bacteroides sp.]|nr:hypothetical protein [Bacteroides sp.]